MEEKKRPEFDETTSLGKVLAEYYRVTDLLTKQDSSETQYLNEKKQLVDDLLKTGIYEDSRIVKVYERLVDIYNRLLFIYTMYAQNADEKIKEIIRVLEEDYILKEEHIKKIQEKINVGKI